jgi:hypothetical protein
MMTRLACLLLENPLEEALHLCIILPQPMAPATPVKVTAGTSLTKAAMCFGLRLQSQQQCARVSIWVSKHTVAGCLA